MQSIWDPMQFMHMCMCGSKSHHDSQSAISPVLKCQERVQALTCPHALLSPVAATGIKLSHILVWAGKSKIGVQESVVQWDDGDAHLECIIPWHGGGLHARTHKDTFFNTIQISVQCEANVRCKVWRAVKGTHQQIRLWAHLCSRVTDKGM